MVVRPCDLPRMVRPLKRLDLTGCDRDEARLKLETFITPPTAPESEPQFEEVPTSGFATEPEPPFEPEALFRELEEQLERASNQMPENYPVLSVQAKIAAARLRFGGKRQSGKVTLCLIGDMARYFHELASTIAAMEEADRPALAALRPAVEKLLRSVKEAGTDAKSKDLTEAPWPPGCQAEIRQHRLFSSGRELLGRLTVLE